MNQEQRAAMRKLAEEATPGPWWHGECTPPDGHALAWMGQSFVDCEGGQKNYAAPSRDAEYIAATNPQAILQLLDYIETLEKDAARYRWLRDTLSQSVGGGVEVNDAALVYESSEPGEYVRVYWYPDTPIGFYESKADTLDAAIDAAMKGEME